MGKLAIVFVVGLALGYSYGFRQSAAHVPSVMSRVMHSFGADRIQADQARHDRAVDAVSR